MKNIFARLACLLAMAAVLVGLCGCLSANYNSDPTREAKQQDIIRFMQSSSEGRGYY